MDKKEKQKRFLDLLRTIKEKDREKEGIPAILTELEEKGLLLDHFPALQQLARKQGFQLWCTANAGQLSYGYEGNPNFIESRILEYLLNEAGLAPEAAEDTVDFFRVIASAIDIRCAGDLTEFQRPRSESPAPDVPQPEESVPEAPQSEASAPEVPEPEASAPEVPELETPAPEGPQSEASAPEVPEPETPVPEAPQSEAPASEASKPAGPAPGGSKGEHPIAQKPNHSIFEYWLQKLFVLGDLVQILLEKQRQK